jgi:hypothetical protein
MNDISDLRHTIIPKSDQINADQLLGGPMTITVTGVKLSDSAEQPVTVSYTGDGGRGFRPCKTMRKLLIHAWGPDARKWPGRSMTLYNDPAVKFGNDTTGGVRISHLSHIEHDIEARLVATRGKKALHVIKRMVDGDQEFVDAMKAAATVDDLKEAFARAYRAAPKSEADRRAIFKAEYDRRMAELAPSALLTEYVGKVNEAANVDAATALLDEARSTLNPTEQAELNKAFAAKFGDA